MVARQADGNKTLLARTLGVSRQSLYYPSRKASKDWSVKCFIELTLREHPSYGSRRIAQALGCNRKRIQRVMRLFGIRPYRRSGKRRRKTKIIRVIYENVLLVAHPLYPHHIWVADFTELGLHGKKIYLATVLDVFTRQIVGVSVSRRKGAPLTIQALWHALLHHPRPEMFHSDNGSEYEATAYTAILQQFGITVSRSRPGCPWENGYQETWYGKFKLELGDPNRFHTVGELVAEIYRLIWVYNNTRIHSTLKMPPAVYAEKQKTALTMAA